MAVSAAKFIEQLSSVSLLASAEVDTLREKLDPAQLQADAEQLAKELVKSGKLTKFQAAALYQGKGKGLVFADYVVLDKLGAGGMGQVFKAHHRRMKRLAAIKVLPPHIMKDAQAVQRFYQEVEMAAKLAHANIVAAYDAGESNGLHYLVMEYVEGRDLSSLLQKQGPLNLEQVMNCIRQAAEGLAYAHAQGVVHRDIKPGNLLVDKSGVVKILDMGLARTVDALEQQDKSSKQELTQAGQVMGTVDYMAPEQARDARTADHRADIYSLGCTLYRLLTGYVPYPADTMVKKLMAHAQQPIPSLKKHCPEVPAKLEELYQRMLEKDPAKRIGSAKEVGAVLQGLLSGTSDERSSVSVLDDPEQAEEWQSFLKAGGSSVSGIGKAAGSTIGKGNASRIGKGGASTISKSGNSVSGVVAAPGDRRKRMIYGGSAAAAIVLLTLGGWFALRGDAEEEATPNAVAAVPTTTKPIAPVVTLPSATAAPLIPPSVAATPHAPAPSPTAVAFNLPAPPMPSATPSASVPLFGLDAPPNLSPTGTQPHAAPAAKPSATAVPIAITTNSPPPPESGENYSLYFEGNTEQVVIPKTLLFPTNRLMTWEATIWPGDPFSRSSKSSCLMGNYYASEGTSLSITTTGILVRMGVKIDGRAQTITLTGPATLLPATRTRLAMVFDRNDWRLFINGRLIARQQISGEPTADGARVFRLGNVGGGATDSFHGSMDEVRISADALYNDSYIPAERLEKNEQTLALYRFNEGSGVVLHDYSGHGHHAEIIGAKWVPTPPDDPRIVPPDSSTLIRVLAEVDKALQPDLLKAKSPLDKAVLAGRLLADAADATKPGEARFAVAQRGLEIAVESGDRAVIDQALSAHEKNFQGSVEERLADVLTAVAKKTLTAAVWQALAALAYERWDRNFAVDQITLARQFADAFTLIARKANHPASTKAVTDLTKRLGLLKPTFDVVVAAQEKLTADPSDAEAHATLGRYLCFDKEDWFQGLEHLSKGNDEALRALAEQSISAGDDLAKIIAAGDAWYDASVKVAAKAKPQYQAAAVFWYLETYNRLTGADLTRVTARLTQLGAKNRSMSFTQAKRERDAAEWALSFDTTIRVISQDGGIEHTVQDIAGLPLHPFRVTSMIFSGSGSWSATGINHLAALKAIKQLHVGNHTLPEGGYAKLAWLTTLTDLYFRYLSVNDDELRQLQPLKNLVSLTMYQNRALTDFGITHLEAFPNLTELDISRSSNVGDAGMIKLAKLKTLLNLRVETLGNRSDRGEQGRSSILAEFGLHGVGQPVEDVAVLSTTGLDHG